MIIFDTETTGLPKPNIAALDKQPKIFEFAAVKLNDETLKETNKIEFLVNPEEKLTEFTKKLCKIKDSDLITKPKFVEYYPELVDFFLGEKYLIAHNVSFDVKMLELELRRIGRETQFPYPPIQICTVNKTINLKGYRLKLGVLYNHFFNENFKDAHRAMVDVKALVRVVRELIKNEIIEININNKKVENKNEKEK